MNWLFELCLLLSLRLLSLLGSHVEHMHGSASLARIQVHGILQQVVDVLRDLYVLALAKSPQLLALLQSSSNVVREELRLQSVDHLGQ